MGQFSLLNNWTVYCIGPTLFDMSKIAILHNITIKLLRFTQFILSILQGIVYCLKYQVT